MFRAKYFKVVTISTVKGATKSDFTKQSHCRVHCKCEIAFQFSNSWCHKTHDIVNKFRASSSVPWEELVDTGLMDDYDRVTTCSSFVSAAVSFSCLVDHAVVSELHHTIHKLLFVSNASQAEDHWESHGLAAHVHGAVLPGVVHQSQHQAQNDGLGQRDNLIGDHINEAVRARGCQEHFKGLDVGGCACS